MKTINVKNLPSTSLLSHKFHKKITKFNSVELWLIAVQSSWTWRWEFSGNRSPWSRWCTNGSVSRYFLATAAPKLHSEIFNINYSQFITTTNSPKCLERQNLTARIVDAIMCIFSKFTRPSMLVLLPSWANVISFSSRGINGMTGGCNLPTDILHHKKLKWMANSGREKYFWVKFPPGWV